MIIVIADLNTPDEAAVVAAREAHELARVRHSRNVASRSVLAFRHAGGTVNDRSWYHEGIARGERSISRCIVRETVDELTEVAASFEPVAASFENLNDGDALTVSFYYDDDKTSWPVASCYMEH